MKRISAQPLPVIFTIILLSACRREMVPAGGRNILLVTIETLRADHVGCYGVIAGLTPNLDRLAARSVLFEKLTTPVPRTNPSLASIMTGLYPPRHGVRNAYLPLSREVPSLAEILRGEGYSTGAVIAHPFLTGRTGLDSGFDYYLAEWNRERPAEETTDEALSWLRSRPGGPFFLWVHYMDPHWTYRPPPSWAARLATPLEGEFSLWSDLAANRVKLGDVYFNNTMSEEEREHVRSLYRAEVAYTDEQVGRLLAGLERMEFDENTLIVILADHGESLGEHGCFFEHGEFTYEETLHVPGMIVFPENHPYSEVAPARRSELVVTVDLLPTILDFLGIPLPINLDGISLMPLIVLGRELEPRLVFGECGKRTFGQNPRRFAGGLPGKWYFVREGPHKLIYIPKAEGGDWEYYDLIADPEELNNLYDPDARRCRRLRSELVAWMDQTFFEPPEEEVFYQVRPWLRTLGYLD